MVERSNLFFMKEKKKFYDIGGWNVRTRSHLCSHFNSHSS